ncbi:hypothetical protein I4U23_029129 [Adineta vaga]|nr:hypothetical protein I4U23_029129 [Adineta vaga]
MSKTEETLRECGRWICHSFDILKAILMRLIFALHATIAIARIVITKGDYWYLLNMCGVNFLLIELIITIVKRKGKEPKWFSPCFFLYICTMIPPIWFLEINRINIKLGIAPMNQTEGDELTSMIEKGLISKTNLNDKTDLVMRKIQEWGVEDAMIVEITFMFIIILGRWILPKGDISHSALSQLLLVYLSLASDILDLLTLFNEHEIQSSLSMVYLVLTVFSLCMFQFALNLTATRGRSFRAEFDQTEIEIHQSAPSQTSISTIAKSQPRHRQFLSKILSRTQSTPTTRSATISNPQMIRMRPVTTAISISPPDTIFKNIEATNRKELQLIPRNLEQRLLNPRPSTVSLSSLQSSSYQNSSRLKKSPRKKSVSESVKFFVQSRSSKFIRSEIWSILVTLALQDGPFFGVRLTAIIVYHVRSFLTYFFTFKNFLILVFQTYRIVSVCLEKDEHEQEFEEKVSRMRRMSMAASQLGIPLNRKI